MNCVKYEKENRYQGTYERSVAEHGRKMVDRLGADLSLRNSGIKRKGVNYGVSGTGIGVVNAVTAAAAVAAAASAAINKSMRTPCDWGMNSSKTLNAEDCRPWEVKRSWKMTKNPSSGKKSVQKSMQNDKTEFNARLNKLLNSSVAAKFMVESTSLREESSSKRIMCVKENTNSQFQLGNLLQTSTICSSMNGQSRSRPKKAPSAHKNISCSSRITPSTIPISSNNRNIAGTASKNPVKTQLHPS